METFQFYLPSKIIFGNGALKRLSEEVSSLECESILLVTGRKSMQRSGVVRKIKRLLSSEVEVHIYRVTGEPDTAAVDRGVALSKKNGCDAVIAVGGGSALDTAKAIAGLCGAKDFTNTSDFLEIDGTRKLDCAGLPFIAIPTTAGTGSEASSNSVIINRDLKTKRSLRSPFLFARTAIIDPLLTMDLPQEITASSGIDALSHLIEAYVSKRASPMTDAIALRGIGLAGRSLVKAVISGKGIEDRTNMSLAALLGGITLANAGLGLVHAIAPFIGSIYGVSHGVSVGLVLPHVMEYNLPSAPAKFRNVASALGEDVRDVSGERAAHRAVEAVEGIIERIKIPWKLSQVGVKEKDLKVLAKKSLSSNSVRSNPRKPTGKDVLEILEKAS